MATVTMNAEITMDVNLEMLFVDWAKISTIKEDLKEMMVNELTAMRPVQDVRVSNVKVFDVEVTDHDAL